MESSTLSSTSYPPGQVLVATDAPNITGKTVAILVGKQIFYVHEALLTYPNPYLSDVTSFRFEKYSQWLYTGKITLSKNQKYCVLAGLYALGDKIMDEDFQQAIIKIMIDFDIAINIAPGIAAVRTIYLETSPTAPAHRLMVDLCAFHATSQSKSILELDPEKDGEYMVDLCAALVKHGASPGPGILTSWITQPDLYRRVQRANVKTN
ncbi:hypothetical protein BKA63DRAFT_559860 [Paraphoma chrysanthemicola]|nr:hypothetical protein BKA63DRAFT_559860 [Paraphoma chrysanthemicola]